MLNTLNDIQIFGWTIPWDVAMFWAVVAIAVLIFLTFIMLVILVIRTGHTVPALVKKEKTEPAPEPKPEFEPMAEPIPEPKPEFEPMAEPIPELQPEPKPISKPVPVETPSLKEKLYEDGTLRYDRSFIAKLIQADDDVKGWYIELKNDLLSYEKVHDRTSWKHETYRFRREPVVKISFRGKTMCLFLPLNPAEFAKTKYKVEDVSDMASADETPCMYRIKNDRRVKYAKELIAIVLERYGAKRIERESVDYFMPYMETLELFNKGLIKRKVSTKAEDEFLRTRQEEAAAAKANTETPKA